MTTQITDPDIASIYQAASDYYGGWYEANVERIARSLHPDLAKRSIQKDKNGKDFLYHLSKGQMLEKTKEGGGSNTPIDKQHFEITILDRSRNRECQSSRKRVYRLLATCKTRWSMADCERSMDG